MCPINQPQFAFLNFPYFTAVKKTVSKSRIKINNFPLFCRPLFENFVQDLLTTVNTPEWPAAELLLSFLGRVLVGKFRDRSTEMALRISSLEYLGVVAARLRKDAVQSKTKVSTRLVNRALIVLNPT